MRLSYTVMSTVVAVAGVSTAVIAAPPTYAAEQQAVTVDSVVVDIDGQKFVVPLIDYNMAYLGFDDQLLNYLKGNNEYPTISALKVGGKYVDLAAYNIAYVFNNGVDSEILADIPEISTEGFKEYKTYDEVVMDEARNAEYNIKKTIERDGIKFEVMLGTKKVQTDKKLYAKVKATNVSEDNIPYFGSAGCDLGLHAGIYTESDTGQVQVGSKWIRNQGCTLALEQYFLEPRETIEVVEILYPPTEGLKDNDFVKVTFQKGILDGTSPLIPIEIPIDIDDFQDDEPVTLVKESKLNDEEKKFVKSWHEYMGEQINEGLLEGRDKAVYPLDNDLFIVTTGIKSHGGYGIEFVKTETSWEKVSVYVRSIEPNPDPNVSYPMIIDYPYLIVKSNLPPYTTLAFVDVETGETIPIKDELNF